MDYEDRISIVTPEGVTLEMSLAGIGSRFVASVLDWLVRLAVLVVVALVAANVGADSLDAIDAVAVLTIFVVQFGYDIAFETLASGRTPGKRWTGLRVVRAEGGPVGLWPSTVRNLLRIVDALPALYLVGVVAVLATSRNQRLGDLAAGTVVVRERRVGAPAIPSVWAGTGTTAARLETAHWDLTAMTGEELATVRRFLDRRQTVTPEARARLASDLATRLRPKVVGPDERLSPEQFLEAVAAAKAARS